MNSNNVMKSGSKNEINPSSYVFITPKKPKSLMFYREKNSQLGHKNLTANKNGINSFSNETDESASSKKDDFSFISPCMRTLEILNKSSCKGINKNVFSSPYDNFLSQSPFSFENYLNSYSRDNENGYSLLNNKRLPENTFNTKKHVRKFSDPCDLNKSDRKFSLSANKDLNQSPILNSNLNLNNYHKNKKLDLIKNKNNNQIDIYNKNDNNLNNLTKITNNITSSYDKSPSILFSDNKLFKNLNKSIEKEISLELSEAKEAIMQEKEFFNHSCLLLEREAYNKKLNFDNDDKRFEVFMELNLNDKKLMNQAECKEAKGKSQAIIKKKLFKIEDFYANNNTDQNTNTKQEEINIPGNDIINSASLLERKKKIFSCLDDCPSTAFNSQKKSKNKNQNAPSRIRKTNSQVFILEELVKSNSVISRELITQASIETGLSFSIVYKWLWDRNNKLKRKLNEEMKNTIENSSILEESEKDSSSEEAESEIKNLKNNLIFKVESDCN